MYNGPYLCLRAIVRCIRCDVDIVYLVDKRGVSWIDSENSFFIDGKRGSCNGSAEISVSVSLVSDGAVWSITMEIGGKVKGDSVWDVVGKRWINENLWCCKNIIETRVLNNNIYCSRSLIWRVIFYCLSKCQRIFQCLWRICWWNL